MAIKIGTFNLNNLFSRFNFQGKVTESPSVTDGGITLTFGRDDIDVRTFMGRLVKEKDPDDTSAIAHRIRDVMDADILAVQEVEHIEILKNFNREFLGRLYPHVVLIEGNDRRLIDVGLMSKLPIGPITSHQAAEHLEAPGERVFGRDLLQVEILRPDGGTRLTAYVCHLKSHYVPFHQDPVEGARRANRKRQREAETIARLIGSAERRGSKFVLLGDMNDPPDSEFLEPMLTIDGDPLTNALASAVETRAPKPETSGQGAGPQTPLWTHRFNPTGPEPPHYELYDQIWVSKALSDRVLSAHIDRRTRHGGDGSDHDPAWIVLDA